ncbi:MAG: hypothetical protein QXE76_01920 [Candidatus Bathyarchaeia archaeon]
MATKRPLLKWSTPKGLMAVALVFLLAVLIEIAIVQVFIALGLDDKNPLTLTFKILGQAITLSISPLFHLIPLSVTIVLVSSWTFLTKHVATRPKEIKPSQKPFKKEKQAAKKGLSKKISHMFERTSRQISSAILRIPGTSYLKEKLSQHRAALRSLIIIFILFAVIATALCFLAYPKLLYQLVIGLYKQNEIFLGFVLATINFANTLGQVLSPISGVAAAINNALQASAPGFKNSLSGLGAITQPLVELDVTGKYVAAQNIAAWLSVFVAFLYGHYKPRVRRR